MKSVIIRKVAYLLPGKSRPVWAFVLAQREALSLLFVERPDDNYSHTLVVATENPAAGVFEDVGANRFPMESDDLEEIAGRLEALGTGLAKEQFRKLFRMDEE